MRLCDITGLEVADRRGYLTMELETAKDGVLLLRYHLMLAFRPGESFKFVSFLQGLLLINISV